MAAVKQACMHRNLVGRLLDGVVAGCFRCCEDSACRMLRCPSLITLLPTVPLFTFLCQTLLDGLVDVPLIMQTMPEAIKKAVVYAR